VYSSILPNTSFVKYFSGSVLIDLPKTFVPSGSSYLVDTFLKTPASSPSSKRP